MTKPLLKIYEQSGEWFDGSYAIHQSMKLKRGWLHLVYDSYCDRYKIVWMLRQRQERCEEVYADRLLSSEEIYSLWNSSGFSYTLLGRRAMPSSVKMPRDSQRAKFYEWERKNILRNQGKLTPDEMTSFIKKVCRENNIVLTKIKYRSGGSCSFARGTNELAFHPTHMNKAVACHEIAHLIMTSDHGIKVAAHGPEWVREYTRLLVTYCGFVEKDLKLSMTKNGIKF